ncbi:hypothetical protein GCM10017674_82430 [Streptomyces gardneri]|nr:hypothetical protein GCM10017674_82430 [Streptomyces gardneri]
MASVSDGAGGGNPTPESLIESETQEGTDAKAKGPESIEEIGSKTSDRIGTAGRARSESETDRKAPRKSDRKDLIGFGTKEKPGGKPARVSTKEASAP